MNQWKECKLGTLISLEYGKSLIGYEDSSAKYPVYGTNGKIGNCASFLSPIPSVIVGRKGAYRGVHFSKTPFYVIDTAFYAKPKNDNIDMLFLYNFLLTIDINSMDSGSAIPSTDRYELYDIDISLPPLPEQHAIAGVLSSLDDKIDLLHRQNKMLEGLAEALWRKMFVKEADPGWKRGKLGDLIELHYGKALKEELRVLGEYPVVGSSGIVGYHNEFLVNGPGIVIGRKGTLGQVNYIEQDFFPIDTTYFVKSKTDSGRLFFEYFLLKEFSFEEMNSDSAVPGLNREIAQSIECTVPDATPILEFNEWCQPLLVKKLGNDSQIRTLSCLRDTLLPKLMSGEGRVKNEDNANR